MITRQRTQQPLERAVAKAMARRAELRAERAAQAALSPADSTSFDLQSETTAALLKETALTAERTAAIGSLSTPSSHPAALAEGAVAPETSTPPLLSGDTEPEDFATEEPSRPALPPAAMGLIERLANRQLDDPIDEELEAGLSTLNFTTLSDPAPSAPASTPAVPPAPETAPDSSNEASDYEPSETASRSAAVDAFQLLLSNNPDADDNTRSDLRSAPSLRNPRKILNSTEPAAEPTDAEVKKSTEAPSNDQETEPSERSLRNWFSPQQDPNPPPPPEHDPSRD